jgi:hypothetical protein
MKEIPSHSFYLLVLYSDIDIDKNNGRCLQNGVLIIKKMEVCKRHQRSIGMTF